MTIISTETKMAFSDNSKRKLKLQIWVTRALTDLPLYKYHTMLSKPVSSRVIMQTLRIKFTDSLINFNVKSLILNTILFADDHVSLE